MPATPALVNDVLARFGARTALEFLDGESWTYAQAWAQAAAFAQDLNARYGLRPGDAVMVQYQGARQAVLYLLGAMYAGWRICPISPTAPQRYILEAQALVRPRLTLLESAVQYQGEAEPVGPALRGGYLIALSSGSTGQPKAIQQALEPYLASAAAFGALSQFDPQTRLYHVLPWVYMAGILNAFLAPWVCGATVIEGEPFQAMAGASLAERALDRGANTLSLVPTMAASMVYLTRKPEVLSRFSQGITQVQCTSAPIPKGLRAEFFRKFGVPLRDCYGITEVGGPVSLQSHTDAVAMNDFSYPTAAHGVRLDGAPYGQEAELMIDSPFAMLGYLENGRITSQVPRPFPTGDLAQLDGGRMCIVGRIKDLIIRGGYNIAPQYIESVVSQCPGVRESAAVGYDAGMAGERMALFVSLWDDTEAARRVLQQHLSTQLQAVEQADKLVVLPSLPRLYNGKLDKTRLRGMIST